MTQVVDGEKAAIFAEEAFVVDVQSFLHTLMEKKGWSRSDLADAMGVSRARVSQIFSDEATNFTVRLLAKAAHAMGEKVELDCAFLRSCRASGKKRQAADKFVDLSNVVPMWSGPANFDESDSEFTPCHGDDRLTSFVTSSPWMAKAA